MPTKQPSAAPPLPRFTMAATLLAAAVSVIVSAVNHFTAVPDTIPAEKVILGADTAAWHLGSEHAAALVAECDNDDERGLRLLDVRARESNIRMRLGDSAADAYIDGFEYSLRQHSDSLASVILD